MICPACQTENEEGSKFCTGCGIQMPASVPTMAGAGGLAGRGARLLSKIIDWAIFVVVVVLVLILGGIDLNIAPVLALMAFAVFVIVQVVLLTKDGQTLGKKALKIRIVKRDTGQNGGFVTNVLLRMVVNWILAAFIPFYGLVDKLFIFREDRRCIHDFIAGTQVIDA